MGFRMALQRILNRQSFHSSAPFYLALLLLVLSLLVSLAGGWVLYKLFREAKEDELEGRLVAIAKAAEPSLASSAEFSMLVLYEEAKAGTLPTDDADWRSWFERHRDFDDLSKITTQLRDLRNNARLTSVTLISPQKRIIADASGGKPGSVAPFVEIDRSIAWDPAFKEGVGTVPLYPYGGVPYKRLYVPIHIYRDGQRTDEIGAVLRIEAGMEAFQVIGRFRTQGMILGAIVTALLATVAILFHRLMRLFARIQASAAHRDRLEAMGLLTAGIAHEIRNPLGIIRALSEAVGGELDKDDPAGELVKDIVGEVERLNSLVGQYLTFAQPDATEPGGEARPFEVLQAVVKLLDKGDKQAVPVELDAAESIPPVRMNTSALRQVLLNLLMNAREATHNGQPVHVRCHTLRAGTQVEIVVSDQGEGIPPRDRKRIFEPFFTTKARGSGLGLSICRYLVEGCGGTIALESAPGRGTTVQVILPAAIQTI
jgi:signal transduction histidine kinase